MSFRFPIRRASRVNGQRGLTLVELMVTLTIGLFMVASLGYVYLASTQVFRTLEANSRVQENLRFAFDRLGAEIRSAGSLGCATKAPESILKNAVSPLPQWPFELLTAPVIGYEDDVSTFPAGIDAKPTGRLRGDALTLIHADPATQGVINTATTNHANRQIGTADAGNFAVGDIVVTNECKVDTNANVIQVTSVVTGAGTPQIRYVQDVSAPGNRDAPLPAENTRPKEGSLFKVLAHTYFIRANAQGEPSLYRQAMRSVGGNATVVTEEVVAGIEDLQIVYGVDLDDPADGSVNAYWTADEVAANAPGATTQERWARVLAVRISLLAASYDGQQPNISPQTYRFNGAEVTAADRKVRKAMTMTMAVRNRL